LEEACRNCSANYKECVTCRYGYELAKGLCRRCNTTATANSQFCFGSCKTSNCSACFPNSVLTQQGTCIYCKGTHAFNGTNCKPCPEYCTKCKYTTNGTIACTECSASDPAGSIDLVDGKCVNRCTGCLDCRQGGNGKFSCVKCQDKAGLNQDKLCLDCYTVTPNCVKCELTGEKMECLSCYDEYSLLNNGTCVECPDNCVECRLDTTVNKIVCIECGHDTVLVNGTCHYCPSGCESCVWEQNRTMCTKCDDAKAVLLQGQCLKCPENCENCRALDGVLTCEKVNINQNKSSNSEYNIS
jgi:hypothetical protein